MKALILESLKAKTNNEGDNKDFSSKPIKVKVLRKEILEKLNDNPDGTDFESRKKEFKKTILSLQEESVIKLDSDGIITLIASKARKKDKKRKKLHELTEEVKEKKKKKSSKAKNSPSENAEISEKKTQSEDDNNDEDDEEPPDEYEQASPIKQDFSSFNPQKVTRLFIGNLPYAIDETSLNEHLYKSMTHVKWITDKETGNFYGSAFVEIATVSDAGEIVANLNGAPCMNRPLKIAFAPARPQDKWPPTDKPDDKAPGKKVVMSERPDYCIKLFIGNLSYEIDDEAITKFFANVGAELKTVRWLHHMDGFFKGCGYAEFWNEEACNKAATLNGKFLLGRPIRIDWAE